MSWIWGLLIKWQKWWIFPQKYKNELLRVVHSRPGSSPGPGSRCDLGPGQNRFPLSTNQRPRFHVSSGPDQWEASSVMSGVLMGVYEQCGAARTGIITLPVGADPAWRTQVSCQQIHAQKNIKTVKNIRRLCEENKFGAVTMHWQRSDMISLEYYVVKLRSKCIFLL